MSPRTRRHWYPCTRRHWYERSRKYGPKLWTYSVYGPPPWIYSMYGPRGDVSQLEGDNNRYLSTIRDKDRVRLAAYHDCLADAQAWVEVEVHRPRPDDSRSLRIVRLDGRQLGCAEPVVLANIRCWIFRSAFGQWADDADVTAELNAVNTRRYGDLDQLMRVLPASFRGKAAKRFSLDSQRLTSAERAALAGTISPVPRSTRQGSPQ